MVRLLKLAGWAVLVFVIATIMAIFFVAAEAQDENVSNPQFIVVWSMPVDDSVEGNPFVDLRVVIRAKNEHVAVVKSTLFLSDKLPSHIMRRMQFVEVAAKKPDEKK